MKLLRVVVRDVFAIALAIIIVVAMHSRKALAKVQAASALTARSLYPLSLLQKAFALSATKRKRNATLTALLTRPAACAGLLG